MSDIKLSDWKALDDIETIIDAYHSGEETDYESLLKIVAVLQKFGFICDEEQG